MLTLEGKIVGTGILVSPNLVLTCAHNTFDLTD